MSHRRVCIVNEGVTVQALRLTFPKSPFLCPTDVLLVGVVQACYQVLQLSLLYLCNLQDPSLVSAQTGARSRHRPL